MPLDNGRFDYSESDNMDGEKQLYHVSARHTAIASSRRKSSYRCSLGRMTRLRWRSWFFLFVLALVVFVLYTANEDVVPVVQHITGTMPGLPAQPKFSLHVLMPSTTRSLDLCRSLITSLSLYYPAPVLLNWGKIFTDITLVDQGARIARIPAALHYLQNLPDAEDEVIVLMTDSEDTWFQLDPDTLLSRYHKINVEAERRIKQRLGAKAVEAGLVRQTILFGASKECHPDDVSKFACSAIPKSPLPPDLYGNLTDMRGAGNDFSRRLPRYLSSSFILGPVKDLVPLLQRAVAKIAQNESETGSDDEIFGVIFGEQEYYREHMRELHASKYMKLKDFAGKWLDGADDEEMDPDATPAGERGGRTMEMIANESFEYGMGLDYFSELSSTSAHSHADNFFLTYDELDQSYIDSIRGQAACSPGSKNFELPADLRQALPPIQWPEDGQDGRRTRWSELPLLTNVCTGRVPVTIHHNSYDILAAEPEWRQLWSQPRLKRILEHRRELAANAASGGARIGTVSFAPAGAGDGKEDATLTAKMHGGDDDDEGLQRGALDSGSFEGLGKITAAWIERGSTGTLDKLEWWDLCEGQGFDDFLFAT